MKKYIRFPKPYIIVLLLLAFSSCKNDDATSADCSLAICTEEFRTIVIYVKDSNQVPVVLDAIKTTNIENGEDKTVGVSPSGLQFHQQQGHYPLLQDGDVKQNEEIKVRFKGFINDVEVVSGNYVVSADCCHINLEAGERDLIIN